jgi:hypothetical protein
MSETNIRYPGRAEYVGPRAGVCFALHHFVLAEATQDVYERVEYVRIRKPEWERAERLRQLCMIPLERLPEEVQHAWAECAAATEDTELWGATVELEHLLEKHEPELLALLNEYVPDHTWTGVRYVLPTR